MSKTLKLSGKMVAIPMHAAAPAAPVSAATLQQVVAALRAGCNAPNEMMLEDVALLARALVHRLRDDAKHADASVMEDTFHDAANALESAAKLYDC